MILADNDIRKMMDEDEIRIKPFMDDQVLPDAYGLTLGKSFRFIRIDDIEYVDVKQQQRLTEEVDVSDVGYVNVRPGELVLASSEETVKLGHGVAGMLQGRTSLSRLGLFLDTSANLISPGYDGRITLVLHNVFALPIRIYVGMRIAELVFVKMSSRVKVGYGQGIFAGRYQSQLGPTESRIWKDFS